MIYIKDNTIMKWIDFPSNPDTFLFKIIFGLLLPISRYRIAFISCTASKKALEFTYSC